MSTTESPKSQHGSSLSTLVSGLISDITTLFRQEIELAKTEAGERVESAVRGGTLIVAGVVLALGALGVFLAGIVTVLAFLFIEAGMTPVLADSLSALVVTVVVGLIGWIMISNGIHRLKTSNFKLKRTAHTLSEDASAVRERL